MRKYIDASLYVVTLLTFMAVGCEGQNAENSIDDNAQEAVVIESDETDLEEDAAGGDANTGTTESSNSAADAPEPEETPEVEEEPATSLP